jgi:hypothetical protein
MSKIDTQGMSGPVTKGCSDNIYPHDENGEPILPKGEWKELPIFDDKERKELKEIMLEALKEYYEGEKTHPAWTLDQFQE